jgi:PPP family 3-phenylpropionic acid transporter
MSSPKSFYFLYFAALAGLWPFLALYYQQAGMNGRQIGLLAGLIPALTLVGAPLGSALADATGRPRAVLAAAIAGAVAGALGIAQAGAFWGLAAAVAVYALFSAPVMPLVDSRVVVWLGERQAQYGRLRLWGALGWGIAAPLLGLLVDRAGLRSSFYTYGLLMLCGLWVAWRLPGGQPEDPPVSAGQLAGCLANGPAFGPPGRRSPRFSLAAGCAALARAARRFTRRRQPASGLDAIPPPPADIASPSTGLRTLATSRGWLLFSAAILVAGIGLAQITNYLFLYLGDLGASKSLMGVFLTIATLSELPVFFYSDRLLLRWGGPGLLALALLACGVRLLAYSFIQSAWLALPLQLLHGLTFAALWIAGVAYVGQVAPPGLATTAQGIFSGLYFGLGGVLGAVAGGWLYEASGAAGLFRWAGIAVLCGLILFSVMGRARTQLAK